MDNNVWDKFVEWWSICDEDEIAKNEFLLFAYQAMWLHNEVLNGGYDQFFDNKEDYWDMEETSRLFKKYLPNEFYTQFEAALNNFKNGDDCEDLTSNYDEDKMQSFLEELALKVVDII